MEGRGILSPRIRLLAAVLAGLVVLLFTAGAVYKWTDKEGKVHYSDTPPAGEQSEVVPVQPGPTPSQQEQARQRAQAIAESVQHDAEEHRARPQGVEVVQPVVRSVPAVRHIGLSATVRSYISRSFALSKIISWRLRPVTS